MTGGRGLTTVDGWLRRHPVVTDGALAAVLAAVLIPASVPLVLDSTAPVATKVAVVTAILVAQGSVVGRRVRPVAAYLACAASMAILVAVPSLTGLTGQGFTGPVPPIVLPSAAVFLLMLYSIAVHGHGRWPGAALAIAAIGAVLTAARVLSAEVVSALAPAGWPLPLIVCAALAGLVAAAWSLGRFHRVRADYVLSLAQRAEQAEADRALRAEQAAARERARIAREMHDVVSHSLAVMVAQAEAGRMAAARDPARAAAVLPVIATTGREAMSDMRSLLGVLRSDPGQQQLHRDTPPSGTDDSTVQPAPALADLEELLTRMRATGLPVHHEQLGHARPLGPVRELTAYRVIQESLTNVIKHAGGISVVVVRLEWTPVHLTITVTDDGRPVDTRRNGAGRGLQGMRERVAAVGGSVSAGAGAEGGFRVSVRIPVPGEPLGGGQQSVPAADTVTPGGRGAVSS